MDRAITLHGLADLPRIDAMTPKVLNHISDCGGFADQSKANAEVKGPQHVLVRNRARVSNHPEHLGWAEAGQMDLSIDIGGEDASQVVSYSASRDVS